MSSLNSTTSNSNPQSLLVSQMIMGVFLPTPTVFLNVILLITIYRSKLRRKPDALLVANLSVSDLLFGIIPGYGRLYYHISIFLGQSRENLFGLDLTVNLSAVATNIVASCTIAAMAFDRLIAVSSPLQYKTRVTTRKIKIVIAVIWIYPVLFSSIGIGVPLNVFLLLYCHLHVSLPLIVLPVVYWKTYRTLHSHNNQVRDMADGNGENLEQMTFAQRNTERRMISAFVLVLVLFYATFFPQYIALNILAARPPWAKKESFVLFLHTSLKVLYVNSILNPFIYAWRIPKYRNAFAAVFNDVRCIKCSRNNVADTSMTMNRPTN